MSKHDYIIKDFNILTRYLNVEPFNFFIINLQENKLINFFEEEQQLKIIKFLIKFRICSYKKANFYKFILKSLLLTETFLYEEHKTSFGETFIDTLFHHTLNELSYFDQMKKFNLKKEVIDYFEYFEIHNFDFDNYPELIINAIEVKSEYMLEKLVLKYNIKLNYDKITEQLKPMVDNLNDNLSKLNHHYNKYSLKYKEINFLTKNAKILNLRFNELKSLIKKLKILGYENKNIRL